MTTRSLALGLVLGMGAACTSPGAPGSRSPNDDCGTEIRVCEDGTPVGRSGPQCDFDPCPGPYDGASFHVGDVKEDAQTSPPVQQPPSGNTMPDEPD